MLPKKELRSSLRVAILFGTFSLRIGVLRPSIVGRASAGQRKRRQVQINPFPLILNPRPRKTTKPPRCQTLVLYLGIQYWGVGGFSFRRKGVHMNDLNTTWSPSSSHAWYW